MRRLFFLVVFFSSALMANKPEVLLFAGSTRRDSINKKLIQKAAEIAKKDGAIVNVIDLKHFQMPLYDGDIEKEKGIPEHAKKFQALLIDSKVVIISTPENNASVSAVLKNALDWASRDPGEKYTQKAFKGKLFVLLSASPADSGGSRALKHLEEIIRGLGGTICSASFTLPAGHKAFDSKGNLIDPEKQRALEALIRNALKGECY